MLSVSYNQASDCFAVAMETGFCVYVSRPLQVRFKRDFKLGIAIVALLHRTNILALVGGGAQPQYPPNKVMIWDDHQSKTVAEIEFRTVVRQVRLRRASILVSVDGKLYEYAFSSVQLLRQIEVGANPHGLLACSHDPHPLILAVPGPGQGQVHVEMTSGFTVIQAHKSNIRQIALSADGSLLATASEKGTIIRVYKTETGQLFREFRRGTDSATISSLALDPSNTYLAAASDKKTVHIYDLTSPSNLYFHDRSFVQFPIDEEDVSLAFGPVARSLTGVSKNGTYHFFSFAEGSKADEEATLPKN